MTDAVRSFTGTDIRSFLVLVEFYIRTVDGFLSIYSPLTMFTQKKVKFELSESCENGFQQLEISLPPLQC